MANGIDPFAEEAQVQQPEDQTNEVDPFSADAVRDDYNYIAGDADSWFSIVKDPNVEGISGYGIQIPDINLDFLRLDAPDEDKTPEELTATESLANTWNNSLDQLSLVDDRFYHLSEQLFGDTDSATYREADARIKEYEARRAATQAHQGQTLALEDIPDAFEEKGLIGGIAHMGAAITNAVASFGTSAIEAVATGGVGLAVDMVQGSVQDYTQERADELGQSYEETANQLGSEIIVPVALGAIAYRFEKAGLKGVGKAIKGLAPGAKKAIITTLNAAGKEGGTEFAQGVVESFNRGFAGKRSLDEGVDSVTTFLEEEALETFLQGAVGGGVTAGGGRSARKAASQLRSNEAERSIVETTEKISKIDEQLNDPNVSDDQKKILKRARTSLENKFKEAIKEPNKDVRKLNDDQINQINKRGDKINKLRKELQEFEKEAEGLNQDEAADAVREDINDKIQKEIDGINKVYENRSTTNVRDEDGALYTGNPAVEAIFEGKQRGEISQSEAATVAYEYEGLARKTAKQLFRQHPEFTEQGYSFEDFVSDLQYGRPGRQSESLIGLAKTYEPGKGSFSGYASKYLRERGKGILEQAVGKKAEAAGKSIDQTEGFDIGYEQEFETGSQPVAAKKLVKKLGYSQETANKFEEAVSKVLNSKKLKTATKQGFDKALTAAGREVLAKPIQEQLGKKDEFFRNLQQNADNYLKLIPKISLANSRGETQKWAETPPTKEEFINYFRGLDVPASTRTDRKKSLAKFIADGIFAETAGELLLDPVVQKQFELVQQFKETDAINSINAARIALINKTPISESRINASKGSLIKTEGVTAADQMTSVLDQAWKAQGHKVQSTTSKKLAIANLVMAEIFPNKLAAEAYLEDVNGFTFTKRNGTKFIYNDANIGISTPIHEMGHVWSGFVLDNNPNLWAQVVTEIVKDPRILMKQDQRLINSGYYSKFGKNAQQFITAIYNQPERAQNLINKAVQNPKHFAKELQALDEIMAGAIEVHGKQQFKDEGGAITKALNKFWDYIGKLLAKVQGKEIQDLTSGELLDLAVNDVTTGKPGSSFAEMNIPIGNAAFEVQAGTYRSQKEYDAKAEAEYKAMEILAKDKSNTGFINAYREVKDHMSQDQFLDWVLQESKKNKLDLTKLQSTFLEDDADSGSVEKAWQDLAGGKLTLLLGRPGKAWQNDKSKIQEKFDKNFESFKKNEALWTSALPSEFWRH